MCNGTVDIYSEKEKELKYELIYRKGTIEYIIIADDEPPALEMTCEAVREVCPEEIFTRLANRPDYRSFARTDVKSHFRYLYAWCERHRCMQNS